MRPTLGTASTPCNVTAATSRPRSDGRRRIRFVDQPGHELTGDPVGASDVGEGQTLGVHELEQEALRYQPQLQRYAALLHEPGGVLDVTDAIYSAVDDRVVRVKGSRFLPQPYTMKLEGASTGAFQTVMLIGIQDRAVLAEIDRFLAQMHNHLVKRVNETMGLPAMAALDPLKRGAGDVSFVAADVDSLAGLGPASDGDHTAAETVNIPSIWRQAKRAALLMTRLSLEPAKKR